MSKPSSRVCVSAQSQAEVSKALVPGQQVIKIVNEELIQLSASPLLKFSGPKPHVIMMVGLQGSGKTTHAGKIAKMLALKRRASDACRGRPVSSRRGDATSATFRRAD
ncbi:MAG: hypothetical protein U0X92_12965 [Anaerolineales bacterium]